MIYQGSRRQNTCGTDRGSIRGAVDVNVTREIADPRDKAPEYALYMLNRQAVKNVTMPLVPGEMKLTVVDTSTLQVARRGESAWSSQVLYSRADDQRSGGGYGLARVQRSSRSLGRLFCGESNLTAPGTGKKAE